MQKNLKRILSLLLTLALFVGLLPPVSKASAATASTEESSDMLANAAYAWSAQDWTGNGQFSYSKDSTVTNGANSLRSWRFSSAAKAGSSYARLQIDLQQNYDMSGKDLVFDVKADPAKDLTGYSIGIVPYGSDWKPLHDYNNYQEYQVYFKGEGWSTVTVDNSILKAYLESGKDLSSVRVLYLSFNFPGGDAQNIYIDNMRLVDHVYGTDATDAASDLLANATVVSSTANGTTYTYEHANKTVMYGQDSNSSHKFAAAANAADMLTVKYDLGKSYDLTNKNIVMDMLSYRGGNGFAFSLYNSQNQLVSYTESYTTVNEWAQVRPAILAGQQSGKNLSDVRYIAIGARFATNTARADRAFYVDNVRIENIDTHSTALQNKNIVFMGDSITAAYGYKGWSGELEEHYLINKYNLGVGGASYATCEGRTTIYAQKDKIPNVDVDFFVLNGGFNDIWSKVELGSVSSTSVANATVNSFDTNTTAGAMEQMFCYLTKNYPNAKIGFVINYIGYSSSWDGVAFRDQFAPLAKSICEKWGVSYLDLSTDTEFNGLYGVHTYDGVHGNDVGYELLMRKMAPWLIGLCDANEQTEQNSDLLAYATYSWSAYTWNSGSLSYDNASTVVNGSESTRSWKFSATSAQTTNAGMQLKLNNLDIFTLTGKQIQFDAKFENGAQKIGLRVYDKNWTSVSGAKTVWVEGNGSDGWQTLTVDASQFKSILAEGCNLDSIYLIALEFDFATNKGKNQTVYMDNFRVVSVTATDATEQASDLLYGAGFVEGSMKGEGLGYDQFNTTFLNGADSKYSLRFFAEDNKTAWGTATFVLPKSIDLRGTTLQFDVNQYNQAALWVKLYDSNRKLVTGDNYTLREIGWQTYEVNTLFGLADGRTAEDLKDIRYIEFSLNLDPANTGRTVVIDNLTTYANVQYESAISGLHGLYLGDSLAEAHNYKGWHGEMAEHYGVTGYNVATGGRALNNNGIFRELSEVPKGMDFDFVLIDGGANDYWSHITVGEVTPVGTTSFDESTPIGGLEKLFYTMSTTYPDAELFFILLYVPNWNTFYKEPYVNEFAPRVRQACEKWGVHLLDLIDNEPFHAEFDVSTGVHTFDGLHANKEGFDVITPYVVSMMEDVFAASSLEEYWTLESNEAVNLTLTEDLYVDLNGHTLSGTINTNGYQVYAIDSTTDQYTCDKMGYFTAVDGNGDAVVPAAHLRSYNNGTIKRYVAIETENGYTFHRFYVGITKQSLAPNVTGVGYKAVFCGDEMVQALMPETDAYGYELQLGDFASISRSRSRDSFVSGKEVTLRVNNFDVENHGETELYASVWVNFNGEIINSSQYTLTLRDMVESVNAQYKAYSEPQLQAVRDMIAANPIMETWSVENILKQDVPRGQAFTAGQDNFYTLTAGDYKTLSFDYKPSGDGEVAVILRGSAWTSFYGDFRLTATGEKTDYAGITTEALEDGYIHVTFDIEALQRTNCVNDRKNAPEDIALIDMYNWTTVDGYIDNIQVSTDAPDPEPVTRGEAFTAGKDNFYYLDEAAAYDYLSFDYKTDGDGEVAVIVRGSKWSTFYGDFRLTATGEKTDYPGITTETLDDGYIHVTFDLAALQRTGCVNNRDTAPVDIKLIDIYNWTTVGGYIDNIQATYKAPEVTDRGEAFTADKDTYFYLEQPGNYDLISFDYKTEAAGEMTAILRGSAWGGKYYGEYRFTESGEKVDYAGVTTETLADGYIRVTFDMAALNRTGCVDNLNNAPADVALIDIYNWTTVGGYLDNIQTSMKDDDSEIPAVPSQTTAFTAGAGTWIKTATAYKSITFDYKLDGDGVMGLILRDDQNWLTYYGGYYFNNKGETTDYAGITTQDLGNGYIRATLIFDELTVKSPNGAPANVEIFDIYGSYTTVNGAFGNVTLDKTEEEEPEEPGDLEHPAQPGTGELVTVTFADSQLMEEHRGNTVNGPKTVRDHLTYAKSINADVLFMPGDVVNNAVQSYYDRFWTIFKSVYGEDETKWPEIIWTMGNHEWYDMSEKDASDAIALFKANAHIESDNLVRVSKVASEANPGQTVANYYKVVNGVPFVVISGDSRANTVTEAQKAELIGWLDEIMELPTVQAGTPIYVAYHLPIADVTYFGQGATDVSRVVDDILKQYPNTIVFTGDTHCPGINERTINQIDYTSINLGSSSYSRIVKRSATSQEGDKYYNVGGNAKDVVTGEVAFGFTYTQNLMVLQNNTDGSVAMDRYVTDTNPADIRKVGITWNFPSGLNKDDFIYTYDRFENKEWANLLYGKDGLVFPEDATVSYSVDGTEMMVYFDDVTDHNCAEHYKITITADGTTSKTYDVVGNYFKYYEEAQTYHFQLSDIPVGNTYKVEVKAYDFFDNESLNSLVATSESVTSLFSDKVDAAFAGTYTDISTKVNYEVTAGSVSSLECYYRGDYLYTYGATLGTILEKKNLALAEEFTITDWSNGVLTMKVKNAGTVAINVGLTVVVNENGADKWVTDFGGEYRKVVQAGSDWVELSWDLNQFGIDELTDISAIRLKVSSTAPSRDGYTMHLYVDDMDVVPAEDVGTDEPADVIRGKAFSAGVDNFFYLDTPGSYSVLSFDYKTEGAGEIAVIIRGTQWSKYYGDFRLTENGEKIDYAGITTEVLEDGYIRATFYLNELQRSGCVDNLNGAPVDVKLIDLYNWTTVNGYIDNLQLIP